MKTLNSGFTKLNRVELADKANHIIATLEAPPGSVNFPEPFPAPVPSLSAIQAAVEALEVANAQNTSVPVTETRNALRIPIQEMLRDLAAYLELVAAGDVEKLATTGYELSKAPVHTHLPPGMPQNVRARATGIDGGIDVRCEAEPLADYYELETSTASAAGPWTSVGTFTGTRSIHAEGFAHGSDVYVHVRAFGTNGPGPWSDSAVVLVS